MEANPPSSASGELPPASSPAAAPAGAPGGGTASGGQIISGVQPPSRYEAQKRRDWNTFQQYLRNHRPPLSPPRCSGAHVIEFLRYLDQFGKTRVHVPGCPFFGRPDPPASCGCPLRQAWGSLDALIGRLRAAFEEAGGRPESSPFAARAVRLYLREVRDGQARARGIPYQKSKRKKRKRDPAAAAPSSSPPAGLEGSSVSGAGGSTVGPPGHRQTCSTAAVDGSGSPPPGAASGAS